MIDFKFSAVGCTVRVELDHREQYGCRFKMTMPNMVVGIL